MKMKQTETLEETLDALGEIFGSGSPLRDFPVDLGMRLVHGVDLTPEQATSAVGSYFNLKSGTPKKIIEGQRILREMKGLKGNCRFSVGYVGEERTCEGRTCGMYAVEPEGGVHVLMSRISVNDAVAMLADVGVPPFRGWYAGVFAYFDRRKKTPPTAENIQK